MNLECGHCKMGRYRNFKNSLHGFLGCVCSLVCFDFKEDTLLNMNEKLKVFDSGPEEL